MNKENEEIFADMFRVCSCADTEAVAKTLIRVLEFASDNVGQYHKLFDDDGAYYLIAGQLERNDLIEHGVSIRCAWITEKGKEFLTKLKEV